MTSRGLTLMIKRKPPTLAIALTLRERRRQLPALIYSLNPKRKKEPSCASYSVNPQRKGQSIALFILRSQELKSSGKVPY